MLRVREQVPVGARTRYAQASNEEQFRLPNTGTPESVPANQQRLIFAGKQLEEPKPIDDETLRMINLVNFGASRAMDKDDFVAITGALLMSDYNDKMINENPEYPELQFRNYDRTYAPFETKTVQDCLDELERHMGPDYIAVQAPPEVARKLLETPSDLWMTTFHHGSIGDLKGREKVALPPSLDNHSIHGFMLNRAKSLRPVPTKQKPSMAAMDFLNILHPDKPAYTRSVPFTPAVLEQENAPPLVVPPSPQEIAAEEAKRKKNAENAANAATIARLMKFSGKSKEAAEANLLKDKQKRAAKQAAANERNRALAANQSKGMRDMYAQRGGGKYFWDFDVSALSESDLDVALGEVRTSYSPDWNKSLSREQNQLEIIHWIIDNKDHGKVTSEQLINALVFRRQLHIVVDYATRKTSIAELTEGDDEFETYTDPDAKKQKATLVFRQPEVTADLSVGSPGEVENKGFVAMILKKTVSRDKLEKLKTAFPSIAERLTAVSGQWNPLATPATPANNSNDFLDARGIPDILPSLAGITDAFQGLGGGVLQVLSRGKTGKFLSQHVRNAARAVETLGKGVVTPLLDRALDESDTLETYIPFEYTYDEFSSTFRTIDSYNAIATSLISQLLINLERDDLKRLIELLETKHMVEQLFDTSKATEIEKILDAFKDNFKAVKDLLSRTENKFYKGKDAIPMFLYNTLPDKFELDLSTATNEEISAFRKMILNSEKAQQIRAKMAASVPKERLDDLVIQKMKQLRTIFNTYASILSPKGEFFGFHEKEASLFVNLKEYICPADVVERTTVSAPAIRFTQKTPILTNDAIVQACSYNLFNYDKRDEDKITVNYAKDSWLTIKAYPAFDLSGTPVGALCDKYKGLQAYLVANDMLFDDYLKRREARGGVAPEWKAIWDTEGADVEWLARYEIHKLWEASGSCAQGKGTRPGMSLETAEAFENPNPLMGAQSLSQNGKTYNKPDHRIQALLSHLAYEPTDVLWKLDERGALGNVRYLGGFDNDSAWQKTQNGKTVVAKHRIHAWYEIQTTSRIDQRDRTLIRLYISHRGSETARDWAESDTGIIAGTTAFYHKRCLLIPDYVQDIYETLNQSFTGVLAPGGRNELRHALSIASPTSKNGTGSTLNANYHVEVYSMGHSLGGFLGLVTSFSTLGMSNQDTILDVDTTKLGPGQKPVRIDMTFDEYITPVVFNPFVGYGDEMNNVYESLPSGYIYRVRTGDVLGFDYASMKFSTNWKDFSYFSEPLNEVVGALNDWAHSSDLLKITPIANLKDKIFAGMGRMFADTPQGVPAYITKTNLNLIELMNTQSIIYDIKALLEFNNPTMPPPSPVVTPKAPTNPLATSQLLWTGYTWVLKPLAAVATIVVAPVLATQIVSPILAYYGGKKLISYLLRQVGIDTRSIRYKSTFDVLGDIRNVFDNIAPNDPYPDARLGDFNYIKTILSKVPSMLTTFMSLANKNTGEQLGNVARSFAGNHFMFHFIGANWMKFKDEWAESDHVFYIKSPSYRYGENRVSSTNKDRYTFVGNTIETKPQSGPIPTSAYNTVYKTLSPRMPEPNLPPMVNALNAHAAANAQVANAANAAKAAKAANAAKAAEAANAAKAAKAAKAAAEAANAAKAAAKARRVENTRGASPVSQGTPFEKVYENSRMLMTIDVDSFNRDMRESPAFLETTAASLRASALGLVELAKAGAGGPSEKARMTALATELEGGAREAMEAIRAFDELNLSRSAYMTQLESLQKSRDVVHVDEATRGIGSCVNQALRAKTAGTAVVNAVTKAVQFLTDDAKKGNPKRQREAAKRIAPASAVLAGAKRAEEVATKAHTIAATIAGLYGRVRGNAAQRKLGGTRRNRSRTYRRRHAYRSKTRRDRRRSTRRKN